MSDIQAALADHAARKCVMASMLYYGLNTIMMGDTDYDKLAKFVSDHYDLLTPIRQWMVGSAEEIRASGYQCRVTVQAADACAGWLARNGRLIGTISIARPWRVVKQRALDLGGIGLRYLRPNEFQWSNQ